MPLPPIPVDRVLTPEPDRLVPAGFTLLDVTLMSGLPQRIPLFAAVTAVLLVPTGLASAWRQADPAAGFSSDDDGWAPYPPTADQAGQRRAPARLMVVDGDDVLGSVPLLAGARSLAPQDGDATRGALVEILVLQWQLHVGAMVGPGDSGSRLRFAWRRADQGATTFTAPGADPRVLARRRGDPAGGA